MMDPNMYASEDAYYLQVLDPYLRRLAYYDSEGPPQPEHCQAWAKLCQDPRWKFSDENSQKDESELYFADHWVGETRGEETIVSVPAAQAGTDMSRGALAPQWVFNVAKPLEEPTDDFETYLRRMICAVTGRLVCISRPDAHADESLKSSQGMLKQGVRYWWRYWDNAGNVYEIPMEKYRHEVELAFHCSVTDATLPGDFSAPESHVWMREGRGPSYLGHHTGPQVTDLGALMGFLYYWTFFGFTGVQLWDECLAHLAETAGVPTSKILSVVGKKIPEDELDIMAKEKGWEKLALDSNKEPAMAKYRKGRYRLEFNLVEGVLSCYENDRNGPAKWESYHYKFIGDNEDLNQYFDHPERCPGTMCAHKECLEARGEYDLARMVEEADKEAEKASEDTIIW